MFAMSFSPVTKTTTKLTTIKTTNGESHPSPNVLPPNNNADVGGDKNGSNSDSSSNSFKNRMTPIYEQLANKLQSRLLEDDSNPKQQQKFIWVAIAGGPGCGKSTVAKAVADILNNNNTDNDFAVVIPADGWHTPKDRLISRFGSNAMKRRGAPWTFDACQSYHDLKHAKEKQQQQQQSVTKGTKASPVISVASLPIYDRTISDPVPNGVTITSNTRIVIVEGLYLLATPPSQPPPMITKSDDDDRPTDKTLEEEEEDSRIASAEQEALYWWGRHNNNLDLFDERWFVKAPSRDEQIHRLIERNKATWSPTKDKLWGPWPDGARKRVETNDIYQMDMIAPWERYADEIIVTM